MGRSRLLDEFRELCRYERKYPIKLLRGRRRREGKRRQQRRGAKPNYGAAEREVLKQIWLGSEQSCGKRLQPAVALWYGIMNGSMGQWNLLTQQSARTRPAAATKRKKKGTDPFFFLFFLSATAGNSPESGRHNFLRVPAMVMAKPKAGSFRQCR